MSKICVRYGLSVQDSIDVTNTVKLIIDSGITSLPAGDVKRLQLFQSVDPRLVDPYVNQLKSIFVNGIQYNANLQVDLTPYIKSTEPDFYNAVKQYMNGNAIPPSTLEKLKTSINVKYNRVNEEQKNDLITSVFGIVGQYMACKKAQTGSLKDKSKRKMKGPKADYEDECPTLV